MCVVCSCSSGEDGAQLLPLRVSTLCACMHRATQFWAPPPAAQPRERHCLRRRRLLKEGAGAKALVHFEKALMLAKFLGNRVQERRAVRGLAAASRIQVRRKSCL